jgi:hypothetical protein
VAPLYMFVERSLLRQSLRIVRLDSVWLLP